MLPPPISVIPVTPHPLLNGSPMGSDLHKYCQVPHIPVVWGTFEHGMPLENCIQVLNARPNQLDILVVNLLPDLQLPTANSLYWREKNAHCGKMAVPNIHLPKGLWMKVAGIFKNVRIVCGGPEKTAHKYNEGNPHQDQKAGEICRWRIDVGRVGLCDVRVRVGQ